MAARVIFAIEAKFDLSYEAGPSYSPARQGPEPSEQSLIRMESHPTELPTLASVHLVKIRASGHQQPMPPCQIGVVRFQHLVVRRMYDLDCVESGSYQVKHDAVRRAMTGMGQRHDSPGVVNGGDNLGPGRHRLRHEGRGCFNQKPVERLAPVFNGSVLYQQICDVRPGDARRCPLRTRPVVCAQVARRRFGQLTRFDQHPHELLSTLPACRALLLQQWSKGAATGVESIREQVNLHLLACADLHTGHEGHARLGRGRTGLVHTIHRVMIRQCDKLRTRGSRRTNDAAG